jgi:hypothetical protein
MSSVDSIVRSSDIGRLAIVQDNARAVFTPSRIALRSRTGRVPGTAESRRWVLVLTGSLYDVFAANH